MGVFLLALQREKKVPEVYMLLVQIKSWYTTKHPVIR